MIPFQEPFHKCGGAHQKGDSKGGNQFCFCFFILIMTFSKLLEFYLIIKIYQGICILQLNRIETSCLFSSLFLNVTYISKKSPTCNMKEGTKNKHCDEKKVEVHFFFQMGIYLSNYMNMYDI